MRNVSLANSAQTVRVRVWISLSGIALAVAFALGVGLLRGQLGEIRYFLIFLLGLLSTVFVTQGHTEPLLRLPPPPLSVITSRAYCAIVLQTRPSVRMEAWAKGQ
jgi:hypothetical protein